MPIAVHVNPAERLRYSVATGKLTDSEVLETYSAMLADPEFDATLDHLVDLTQIEKFEVTAECVRAVAEFMALADDGLPEGRQRQAAIVAETVETIAAALAYRKRRAAQEAPVIVRCFLTVDEARAWLGRA